MMSYFPMSQNPSDYLLSSQIYTLTAKLQTYLQSFVKIFNNDTCNLLFQFSILKLVSGIPINSVLSQLKIILISFYLKYIKNYFRKYTPSKVIFSLQMTRTTDGHGSRYGSAEKTGNDIKWDIDKISLAILWKINSKSDYICDMINTDLKYIDDSSIDGIMTSVLVPGDIYWHKLDDCSDVFVDIYGVTSDKNANGTSILHKELVVKSNTMTIDQLKKYINDISIEFDDYFANKFLTNQRIFIKSDSSEMSTNPNMNDPMSLGMMNDPMSLSMIRPTNPYLSIGNFGSDNWRIENFSTNKTWKTFFIENKQQIRENMEGLFSTSVEEELRVGRVSKKLILAYGPSRCGKNSLFKILTSQLTGKHLIYIQPGSVTRFSDFEKITTSASICGINMPSEKRIYQLDEIDKSIHDILIVNKETIRRDVEKRHDGSKYHAINIEAQIMEAYEKEVKRRNLELSKWLTYLDGAHEDIHKIIFMTAENIDKIHPSFLKRFRLIEVKKTTRKIVRKIITMYFQYDGLNDDINELMDNINDYVHTHSDVYDSCENSVTCFKKKINNYEMIKNSLDDLIRKQNSDINITPHDDAITHALDNNITPHDDAITHALDNRDIPSYNDAITHTLENRDITPYALGNHNIPDFNDAIKHELDNRDITQYMTPLNMH